MIANIFLNQDYITMWTAFGAVGQGVVSLLAIITLPVSIIVFKKSLKDAHYGELDQMYFDLLRLGVEKIHLRNPKAVRSPDQQAEYDTYAFMVWNFIETINDRCGHDKNLCATWHPAIEAENRLHRDWFEKSENRHKFKDSFYRFVSAKFTRPNSGGAEPAKIITTGQPPANDGPPPAAH